MAGYYSPFLQHVLSYWKHRHEEHLLFLTYEEMKSDLVGMVNRVANFLGKTLTPKQVPTWMIMWNTVKILVHPSLDQGSLGLIFIDKEAAFVDLTHQLHFRWRIWWTTSPLTRWRQTPLSTKMWEDKNIWHGLKICFRMSWKVFESRLEWKRGNFSGKT